MKTTDDDVDDDDDDYYAYDGEVSIQKALWLIDDDDDEVLHDKNQNRINIIILIHNIITIMSS